MKSALESRVKIIEIKCNEAVGSLSSERRKFQILTEERKIEETQIMQELGDKNERIQQLTEELLQLEGKYRDEMETILNEEKEILVRAISNKIQEADHKCKVYEGQLQHYSATLQQLQDSQQKIKALEAETRKFNAKGEEDAEKVETLNSKVSKLEASICQSQKEVLELKQVHEKGLR